MRDRMTVAMASGLAALIALAIASGATASVQRAGGISYVTRSIDVPGKDRASGTAACPKHTRVLGGGETNSLGYGNIVLEQTFPEDGSDRDSKPDDGWQVRVANRAAKKKTVKVEAICGDTKVSYRKHRFDVPAMTESDEQDLNCPQNTFAYSGGVGAGRKGRLFLNSTFPANPTGTGATAWGAYVDNPGDATHATLYAVCGKSRPKIVSASVNPIPAGTQGGVGAPCPAGRHAYGGGMGTTAAYKGVTINTLAFESKSGTPGTGWRTAVDVTGTFAPLVTVDAVCGRALG